MYKKIGLLLAICLCLVSFPAVAAECPRPSQVNTYFDLRSSAAPVRYDFTHGRSDLIALGHGTHEGMRTSGLTLTKLVYAVEGRFLSVPMGQGQFCIWPMGVGAKISYRDMTIYVDRNYKPGTCEYNTILDHERAHVRIHQDTLRRNFPFMKRIMDIVLWQRFPVIAATEEEGRAQAGQVVSDAFAAVVQRMERERDALHAQLDSPVSYTKTQALCKNW